MSEERINIIGYYFLLVIGLILSCYAIYSLITGYANGFKFHIWNIQVFDTEALIVNIAYLVLCALLIFAGIRGVKRKRNEAKWGRRD